jgi:predicted nucleotidyltransferase
MRDFVQSELIFMTLAGSHMYGTSTPTSDIDKRGVCVPPRNVVMGFARNFDQQEFPGEDTTVFALTKFMKLAADCNPNIIELIFAPKECIQHIHPTWERLLTRKQDFLSGEAFHTFTGYAVSQLKRIRTHRDWLLKPPTHKPTREEYGLEETGTGIRDLVKGTDASKISGELVDLLERERHYKAAMTTWGQYETWKKERNQTRSALEADFGYDTKHAGHLVRLLRMGKEILTQGTLTVRRPDAEELLAIRRGKWTYDQLMANVDPLKAELETIYQAGSYPLPKKANKEALSDFCVELHEFHWSGKKS